MNKDNIRSFIAIDLPENIKEELYRLSLDIKSKIDGLRPTQPQNIHLTLKFLGNIPESSIDKIKDALDKTTKDCSKFSIILDKIGIFPNYKFPRVLWVAPEQGIDKIKQVKKKLDNQLILLGISKDQKTFKAHITIARIKYGKKIKTNFQAILENIKLDIKSAINIESLHLYKSVLTSNGPIYTKLHSSKLKS
jgi:2'-5' RNA ligase